MKFKIFSILFLISIVTACQKNVQQVVYQSPVVVKDKSKVKPVAITKVVGKLRRGQEIGELQVGLFCIPNNKIRWKSGGKVNLSSDELVDVFKDELEKNGWPVVGSTEDLFTGYDVSGAEILIAAKIKDIDSTVCLKMAGFGNFSDGTGSMRIKVIWQIYNPSRKEIIGEIETSGSSIIKESTPETEYELLNNSFAMAVNNLLASNEFIDMTNRIDQLVETKIDNNKYVLKNNIKRFSSLKETLISSQKSTVTIRTASGMGSGFAVGDGGYVLTNAHVVGDAQLVTLITSSGIQVPGKVLVTNKGRDISLVKVDTIRLPSLHISKDIPKLGDKLYAIGSPLDEKLAGTVTSGIYSSKRIFDGYEWLQSDVAVSPGNSGGPLINEKGSVVGITTAGMTPNGSQVGLNLFIPINDGLNFIGAVLKK